MLLEGVYVYSVFVLKSHCALWAHITLLIRWEIISILLVVWRHHTMISETFICV